MAATKHDRNVIVGEVQMNLLYTVTPYVLFPVRELSFHHQGKTDDLRKSNSGTSDVHLTLCYNNDQEDLERQVEESTGGNVATRSTGRGMERWFRSATNRHLACTRFLGAKLELDLHAIHYFKMARKIQDFGSLLLSAVERFRYNRPHDAKEVAPYLCRNENSVITEELLSILRKAQKKLNRRMADSEDPLINMVNDSIEDSRSIAVSLPRRQASLEWAIHCEVALAALILCANPHWMEDGYVPEKLKDRELLQLLQVSLVSSPLKL